MKSKFARILRPLLAACAGVLVAQGAAWAGAASPATPAASAASASPTAKAAAVSTAQGGQRNKMKACNAEAREKDLHKAERRAFMKQCLSKGSAA
jgi:hypothetical protein